MARNHARVHVAIWQDEDFIDLRPSQQRLYLFLLSQPNLSHLGVLPLTLRRWARTAQAYSGDDLRDDLLALEEAGFVVVDEAEEELLVRSLLRNDGIYKQPNVMRSAIASAPAVQSDTIKRTLLSEVARITLDDVTEDKGKRDEARGLIGVLEVALAVPEDTSPKGSENPKRGVPDTPSEGVQEGFPIPPTYARAQPLVLSPTPSPPPTSGEGRPSDDRGPTPFDEFWSAYPRKVAKIDARKAYSKARKTATHEAIVAGAVRFASDRTRDQEFTPYPASWLNDGRWEDEGPVRPTSNVRAITGRIAEGDEILREAFNRGQAQRAQMSGQQELGA